MHELQVASMYSLTLMEELSLLRKSTIYTFDNFSEQLNIALQITKASPIDHYSRKSFLILVLLITFLKVKSPRYYHYLLYESSNTFALLRKQAQSQVALDYSPIL